MGLSPVRVGFENGGSLSTPVVVSNSMDFSVIAPRLRLEFSVKFGDDLNRPGYGGIADSSEAEWDEAEVAVGDIRPGLLL